MYLRDGQHVDGLQVFAGAELHLLAPNSTGGQQTKPPLTPALLDFSSLSNTYRCCAAKSVTAPTRLNSFTSGGTNSLTPQHIPYRSYEAKLLSPLGQQKSGSRMKDLERKNEFLNHQNSDRIHPIFVEAKDNNTGLRCIALLLSLL